MKQTLIILLGFIINLHIAAQTDSQLLKAQTDSTLSVKQDSVFFAEKNSAVKDSLSILKSDIKKILADTIHFSPGTLNVDSFGTDNTSVFTPGKPPKANISWQNDTTFKAFLLFSGLENRTNFQSAANNKTLSGVVRPCQSKDHLFYTLAFIFLFLGFIKSVFSKYFNQIFTFSFQVVTSQKQTREQLGQNNLPSLLMNILFIFSGSLFLTLIAQYYKWIEVNYWLLLLYTTIILSAVYFVKFLFINFAGWVFNAKESANSYSNIVFLINKIIGVLLLPVLLLIAFAEEPVKGISITAALCMVILLFIFRYFFSLVNIRKNLNISAFHFFIYLCAVEIMPLLIIYKALFLEIRKSN